MRKHTKPHCDCGSLASSEVHGMRIESSILCVSSSLRCDSASLRCLPIRRASLVAFSLATAYRGSAARCASCLHRRVLVRLQNLAPKPLAYQSVTTWLGCLNIVKFMLSRSLSFGLRPTLTKDASSAVRSSRIIYGFVYEFFPRISAYLLALLIGLKRGDPFQKGQDFLVR